MAIAITQYVVDRTEYINPADPTGAHIYRVSVSDMAPGGSLGPGMVKTLDGLSAADAAAYTPGTQLDVTFAVHAA